LMLCLYDLTLSLLKRQIVQMQHQRRSLNQIKRVFSVFVKSSKRRVYPLTSSFSPLTSKSLWLFTDSQYLLPPRRPEAIHTRWPPDSGPLT
jgi:hypothetical protein